MAHYLQSITPALALGGELVYHRRPGEEGTVTSFLGRYTGKSHTFTSDTSGFATRIIDNWPCDAKMVKDVFFSSGDNYVATLTLGGAGAHATYYHKANDQVPNTSSLWMYWSWFISQSCPSVCLKTKHTSMKNLYLYLDVVTLKCILLLKESSGEEKFFPHLSATCNDF